MHSPAGHPAARRRQLRRPAPRAHRAPGQQQRRRPRPHHRPGRRSHAHQDPHRRASTAMAPGPASVAHQLAAASLQPYLVHIRPGNALRRRARPGGHPAVRQLAPGAHRAHGHNIDLVDVRALPKIHIAVPAPRWRQGRAHAWPWPGSKRTAHQLAAAACSCTWCAPGQVVRSADALALVAILQHADGNRAGQRRARIEHLASINVAGHGRNTADRRRYRFTGSTLPCRRRDGARAGRMHGPGQDRSARRTSWRPPAAVPGTRPARWPASSTPASAARASSTWPASTSPATAATLPIDVGTALQDPHCRAGAATAHGGAHARPWPGPEHTAHQLAATTCSGTW